LTEVDFTTQFYRMCLARNLDEFRAAVAMNQLMEQNVMYADVEGNIFYVRTGPGSQNPRGRRALDLLATADRMTLEDATRITLDTYAGDSEHWRAALTAAAKAFAGGARVGVLKEALDLLANWAGHRSVDSPAATPHWVWRAKLKDDNAQPAEIAILQGTALPRDQQETLLRALAAARDEIVKRSGHREVPWGEVHRIRRGDQSWPAATTAVECSSLSRFAPSITATRVGCEGCYSGSRW